MLEVLDRAINLLVLGALVNVHERHVLNALVLRLNIYVTVSILWLSGDISVAVAIPVPGIILQKVALSHSLH